MMPRLQRTPSYRLHKPTGQAVVTLNGRDFYLGPHGTMTSRREYDRVVAGWLQRGRQPTELARDGMSLSVVELIDRYWQHVEEYYVKGDRRTSEPASIRQAMKPLRRLYGRTLAADFGPLRLKAVRQAMIDADWSRGYINDQVDRIRRMFKWATGNELADPKVYQALQAVPGLRRGRSQARETAPVRPVNEAHINAIQPFVSRQVGR
jgi:hypothetical protein